MQTGVSFAKKTEVLELLDRWRKNIPGGPEHIAGFDVRKALPSAFLGRQSLTPDDSNGEALERKMHAASNEEILIVYGDTIYPPARHSLMLLAQDSPVGAQYNLKYEKNVSKVGDDYPPVAGKHYSKITGRNLALLQGKLERHMDQYATQDRLSGFLGQIYSALARPDSSTFKFSEYVFLQSVKKESDLVLQGKDGLAIIDITSNLNRVFGKKAGWKKLEHRPVSYFTPTNPISASPHTSNDKKASLNDSSEQVVIPVEFFNNPEHMGQLEILAGAVTKRSAAHLPRTFK